MRKLLSGLMVGLMTMAVVAGTKDGDAFLGVMLSEETEHPEGGARVTAVIDDSAADEAGLLEDDIIQRFDGKPIRGPMGLSERMSSKKPGDRVSITVVRDGRQKTFDVELGQHEEATWRSLAPMADPEHWEEFGERMQELGERLGERFGNRERLHRHFVFSGDRPMLGVQLIDPTPELREHLGSDDDTGVLVSKVIDGSAAEEAGIRVGDLIVSVEGEPIEGHADLVREIRGRAGESFSVRVLRDGRPTTIDVTLPEPAEREGSGPRAFFAPRSGVGYAVPFALEAPPMPDLPTFELTLPDLPAITLPDLPPLPDLPAIPAVPRAPVASDRRYSAV